MSSDRLNRTFVIRTKDDLHRLWHFLKENAGPMAKREKFMEVKCYEWKPKASDAQRGAMWIINQTLERDAWVHGERFDADTWHEHLKREFLPDETRKGVKKWRVLPTGERVLHMSTENLDREEKTAYIDQCIAFAASIGVEVVIERR